MTYLDSITIENCWVGSNRLKDDLTHPSNTQISLHLTQHRFLPVMPDVSTFYQTISPTDQRQQIQSDWWCWGLPTRELTYPTWGIEKSSSNVPLKCDMLVSRRVASQFSEHIIISSCKCRVTGSPPRVAHAILRLLRHHKTRRYTLEIPPTQDASGKWRVCRGSLLEMLYLCWWGVDPLYLIHLYNFTISVPKSSIVHGWNMTAKKTAVIILPGS